MFKKILKNSPLKLQAKFNDEQKKVINELKSTLQKCYESEGFCIFLSHLYKEDKEDKLRHYMFSVNFKDADLPIVLTEYNNLTEEHLQKNQLKQARSKVVGAVPAPVEKKEGSEETEKFKVEVEEVS